MLLGLAPAFLAAQAMKEKTRVAVIGVGNRGAYLLQQALTLPNVEIVAICDLDEERLAKAKAAVEAKGGSPVVFTDYRKMLDERKDIEAVILATPVDTHRPIATGVMEVGKSIYCEKPMAHTASDARLMAAAAKQAKGVFQIGFQLRHDPARRAAMEFVKGGGIGDVRFLQGYRHTGDLPYNTPWLFDAKRSGDIIVEQACHILDLMTWAAGAPPLRCFGSGGINHFPNTPPGRSVMDNYALVYEFPNDVRLSFSQIYFDPPGFSGIKERVYGSKGAVDLPTATFWELEKRTNGVKLDVPNQGARAEAMAIASFLDAARAHTQPLNDAESGLRSTMVAMMGRKAIYEKRVVTWQEMLAED
jgi:predicted dehydrogenase